MLLVARPQHRQADCWSVIPEEDNPCAAAGKKACSGAVGAYVSECEKGWACQMSRVLRPTLPATACEGAGCANSARADSPRNRPTVRDGEATTSSAIYKLPRGADLRRSSLPLPFRAHAHKARSGRHNSRVQLPRGLTTRAPAAANCVSQADPPLPRS